VARWTIPLFLTVLDLFAGPRISYYDFREALLRRSPCGPYLEKFFSPSIEPDLAIRIQAVADEVVQNALRKIGPGDRLFSHLLRLLEGRSEAEKKFGHDLAVFWQPTRALMKLRAAPFESRALETLNGQDVDTTVWWTLAPYAFLHLRNRGVTPQDAIMRLITWAAIPPHEAGSQVVHLRGLESYNREFQDVKVRAFTLQQDPRHISHAFASQEALILVEDDLI